MIVFHSITSFRKRLAELLKVRRNVYCGVADEIKNEFQNKSINDIRQNRDMILAEGELVVLKLRLPDKRQKLSRKDAYRLIYLVSKKEEIVVFLDIYPKNGPLQKINISNNELKSLLQEFIIEAHESLLESFDI